MGSVLCLCQGTIQELEKMEQSPQGNEPGTSEAVLSAGWVTAHPSTIGFSRSHPDTPSAPLSWSSHP